MGAHPVSEWSGDGWHGNQAFPAPSPISFPCRRTNTLFTKGNVASGNFMVLCELESRDASCDVIRFSIIWHNIYYGSTRLDGFLVICDRLFQTIPATVE